MDWFLLIFWTILGIINLFSEKVGKFDYFMVWILLVMHLIKNVL